MVPVSPSSPAQATAISEHELQHLINSLRVEREPQDILEKLAEITQVRSLVRMHVRVRAGGGRCRGEAKAPYETRGRGRRSRGETMRKRADAGQASRTPARARATAARYRRHTQRSPFVGSVCDSEARAHSAVRVVPTPYRLSKVRDEPRT